MKWTESVGVTLVGRDLTSMQVQTPSGHTLNYEILQLFPFTSETKRMGIIVKVRMQPQSFSTEAVPYGCSKNSHGYSFLCDTFLKLCYVCMYMMCRLVLQEEIVSFVMINVNHSTACSNGWLKGT